MNAPAPPAEDTPALRRRRLRERAIAAREALPPALRAELTHAMEAHLDELLARLDPAILAFCWPHRGEPDLRSWVGRWLRQDVRHTAVLPVVLDKAAPLMFRRWVPGLQMPLDRHGIAHPPEGEFVHPDVVLVPLNAFDAAGFRLGYGGGYFDRTLAAGDICAVGVGFELARAPTVWPQPHDRPMDWIVTEHGTCAAGAAAQG